MISIHAAREGGDRVLAFLNAIQAEISIHAAREGGDTKADKAIKIYKIFQSTPPVKAATTFMSVACGSSFISIHAAREGGDAHPVGRGGKAPKISIHAAREGGDTRTPHPAPQGADFNPRRP